MDLSRFFASDPIMTAHMKELRRLGFGIPGKVALALYWRSGVSLGGVVYSPTVPCSAIRLRGVSVKSGLEHSFEAREIKSCLTIVLFRLFYNVKQPRNSGAHARRTLTFLPSPSLDSKSRSWL